jgi:hypothetical protein
MDMLPTAIIMTMRAMNAGARSALPDAPVIAHVERVPVARRTRDAVAGALRQLADTVAAPPPARPARPRHTLCAETGGGVPRWDESR